MNKTNINNTINKTPALQRQIRQQFNVLSTPHPNNVNNEDREFDGLTTLLKKTWNMWAVSSMYGFSQMDQVSLKLYGKRLREELGSILPGENVSYEAFFSVDENIVPPKPTDAPPIKIEINSKDFHNQQKIKCIYNGILLSWGTSLMQAENDSSVKLPLLLCKGTKTVMKAVHSTLSNMFDCIILALKATEEDLKWIVPISLEPFRENEEPTTKNVSQISFEFVLPDLPENNSITFKFETPFLRKLWTIISENDNKNLNEDFTISLEQIEMFNGYLYEQAAKDSGLQLGLTKMHKISLPTLTVMDQKMKALDYELLNKVLHYFNEKAVELLHTLNFDSTHPNRR